MLTSIARYSERFSDADTDIDKDINVTTVKTIFFIMFPFFFLFVILFCHLCSDKTVRKRLVADTSAKQKKYGDYLKMFYMVFTDLSIRIVFSILKIS